MGVPLETGRTSAFDTEDGYRIARAEYELPEFTLDRRGGRGGRPRAAAVGVRPAGAAPRTAPWSSCAPPGWTSTRSAPCRSSPAWTPASPRSRPATPPPATAAGWSSTTAVPTRTPPSAGTSSRGAWSPGTAAGTWWAWTSTGRRRGCSGCPGSSAARPSPGRRAPSSRRPASTSPRSWPGRPGRGGAAGGRASPPRDGGRPAPHRGAPRRRARTATTGCSCRTTEPQALADQLAAYGPDVVVEAPTAVRDAVVERLTRLAAMGRREHARARRTG